MAKMMIDPPSGWQYGFPRVYDETQDGPIDQFLLDNGYPPKDVEFALQYMRSWPADEDPT